MTDRVQALQADVVWNIDQGRSAQEVEEFRRRFIQANESISTSTLRTSAAQGRLDQALSRHGVNSRQAASALLALRREEEAVAAAAESSARRISHSSDEVRAKLLSEERALGRFTRGALEGGGALSGAARALAFGSS